MRTEQPAPPPERCACGHDWPGWSHTPTGCKLMRYNPVTEKHDPTPPCVRCGHAAHDPTACGFGGWKKAEAEGKWRCDCASAPPPERTLTREEYEYKLESAALAGAEYDRSCDGAAEALLAHDAALRAEVERLEEGDEQRVRDLTRHIERADAAEAEVERLNDGAKRNAALLAEQREIEKTLREENERLTRERDAHEYAAVRLKEMLNDEEARVAALEAALREIVEGGHNNDCVEDHACGCLIDIARTALAGEGK